MIFTKSQRTRLFKTIEVNLARFSISVLLSYFIVTLIVTIGVSIVTSKFGSTAFKVSKANAKFRMALLSPGSNYLELTDAVTSRNLFNSEGKFPERKKKDEEKLDELKVFDVNSECKKTKIPISLVGTIVAGRGSMAIVQENGRKDSDVYRIGQAIFDYEEAIIHSVSRYEVVINNDSVKECLQLKKPRDASYGDEDVSSNESNVEVEENTAESKTFRVKSEFVEKELGPGMSNILEKARIVPISKDGEFQGFKIFAIKGGSLFKKIGLNNNDIIKKVNGTVIQPDQGSLLLESFQTDREIIVEVLSGAKPKTLTVLID